MNRKRSSPARAAMKLLCTMLGLILAVMVVATAYFQHLMGQLNYVDFTNGLLPDQEITFPLSDTDKNNKNLINILLIGQDRREGEGRTRSDTMILCTFNKKTDQLIMTSFLRDLYVSIPGYASNRINAAYAFGGMPLLSQTIQENFGVQVNGCIEVDFSQFCQIIDLLGGVSIELRQDEAKLINEETGSSLSAGLQKLNGTQALSYSRIRKLDADGDFSRTNRQRKVMGAIVDAYKSAELSTLLKTVVQILPMITTDLSQGQLLRYAATVAPQLMGAEIISQRVPADGQYSGQSIDGMSVLVADMEAVRETLQNTLNGIQTEPAA